MGWTSSSGVTDANAIHDNASSEISAIAEKVTLVDNDLFLIEDSAAANVKKRVKKSNVVASAAVPDWVTHLTQRLAGETPHADDDFFDVDSSADYTAVNPTGSTTWTIDRGLLSVLWSGQSAADYGAYLKALTPVAAPVTIEGAIKFFTPVVDFFHVGIVLADGTTTGSKAINVEMVVDNSLSAGAINSRSGTLTNLSTVEAVLQTYWLSNIMGRIYFRLVWTAANTFRIAISPDGVSWSNGAAGDLAFTQTPTHFGATVTTWGGAGEGMAAFDYLRVATSDLSV